nr:hypothetical protein OH826_19355 [Streptomyces sp. NBC_00899]
MVWLGDASQEAMWTALRVSWGIDVDTAERLALPDSTSGTAASWWVESHGEAFEVGLHRSARDVERARVALDAGEHCRLYGLPLPEAVPDVTGSLVCPTEDGGGFTVTRPVHGAPMNGPLTPLRARTTGTLLGRLHRALSGYPLPAPRAQDGQAAFLSATLDQLLLAVDADQRRAGVMVWGTGRHKLDFYTARRCEHLREHLVQARGRLDSDLTLHVVHGAFTAGNLRFGSETGTAVTGLRAPVGYPALELAQLAFDPVTVAAREDWIDLALAAVDAYASCHPYLPRPEIRALADIAVLDLLTRTPHHPQGVVEAWKAAHEAVVRVCGHLGELRAALAEVPTAKGSSR